MRKMKDSGVEWIGEIPQEWNVERIGKHFQQRIELVSDKDFAPLSVTKLGILPQLENAAKTANGDNRKLVRNGDYVINSRSDRKGSSGVAYMDGSVSLINIVLKPIDCCMPFFNMLFRSYHFTEEFYRYGHGIVADLWTTRFSEMKNIQIPVPSIIKQQAIADYLDRKCGEIDRLVALQEEMIAELGAYKQSVISEAVTRGLNPDVPLKDSGIDWIGQIPQHWEVRNLSKIIWLRSRLGWRGLKAEEYTETGYPFLSAFNIVDNRLVWNELNFINKERYNESPEIKLSIGDILIVKDGAGIGKCAIVDSLPFGESTVNSSLGVITPLHGLDSTFLYYFLLSDSFQRMVIYLKNGMGVPHLTQTNMRSVNIQTPPLAEQQAIASYLNRKCADIDSLIALKQQKIGELGAYKRSLIFECVTGKREINQ